jgi:hypothetical protein
MTATAIECKLIREGGSFIPMGDIEYHFAPQPDGAHVALVENEEHADRFLSITEGYRLYRGETKAVETKTYSDGTQATGTAPLPDEAPEHDERTELAAEYERLYGKAPHARTGIDKLRELIAAKQ